MEYNEQKLPGIWEDRDRNMLYGEEEIWTKFENCRTSNLFPKQLVQKDCSSPNRWDKAFHKLNTKIDSQKTSHPPVLFINHKDICRLKTGLSSWCLNLLKHWRCSGSCLIVCLQIHVFWQANGSVLRKIIRFSIGFARYAFQDVRTTRLTYDRGIFFCVLKMVRRG